MFEEATPEVGAGESFFDPAYGFSDPVSGDPGAHWAAVPQGGSGVRRRGRRPGDPLRQEFQRVFTGTTYHCDEGGGGFRGLATPRPTVG